MKYALTTLLILLTFASFLSGEEEDKVRNRLSEISFNNTNLVEGLFSLKDTRPFSIIQFDKTIEMYEHEWIKPETLSSSLNDSEKNTLLEKISEYLKSMDTTKRERILIELSNWCIVDKQFGFITDGLNIKEKDLLRAVLVTEPTMRAVNSASMLSGSDFSDANEIQISEALTEAKNAIATMILSRQLKYYSSLYNNLSEITAQ